MLCQHKVSDKNISHVHISGGADDLVDNMNRKGTDTFESFND